jgi:hypothetical protein
MRVNEDHLRCRSLLLRFAEQLRKDALLLLWQSLVRQDVSEAAAEAEACEACDTRLLSSPQFRNRQAEAVQISCRRVGRAGLTAGKRFLIFGASGVLVAVS